MDPDARAPVVTVAVQPVRGLGHTHAAIVEVRLAGAPALFGLGLADGEDAALLAAGVSALNRAGLGLNAVAPPARAAQG
jgi:hypothetical protein